MSEDFDGEYQDYNDNETSLIDDAIEIRDDAKDLKKKWDDMHGKKEEMQNNPADEAKRTNQTLKDRDMARNSNGAGAEAGKQGAKQLTNEGERQAAKEGGKELAKEAGKQAAKEGGKELAKEAGKELAKEGAKQVAKEGTKVAAQTALKAIPYVGWALAAIDLAIKAIKLRNKAEKKVKESTGIDMKLIRRLWQVAPLVLIFGIIMLIILVVVLLLYHETTGKADSLREALACAESSGCTDFKNTGITISSASVPLGGLASTIVEFSGETLDATDQYMNNKFTNKLNEYFDEAFSKDLIYFTDLQIARFVIEYLMFENKYYGWTDSLTESSGIGTINARGVEGDEKEIIDWLFDLLLENKIIADIYEAYSLFNWLKLEKVAFNKIKWQIYYTGISGTGVGFIDDTLKNFCTDTTVGRLTQELTDFCNESKATQSLTFKVVGDINPFTSMLFVPTTLWSAGDAAINAADVFGITDKLPLLQSWKAQALPDQEKLVAAVSEYLPTWVEIYTAYTSTKDLRFANKIYEYYIDNLDEGGDFELKVSLYALRNYSISRTLDFGEKRIRYNIYDSEGELISYKEGGETKYAENLTESEMKEFVGSGTSKDYKTVDCSDTDYKNGTGGCKKAVTKYRNSENKKVSCTDSDYNSGTHGCTRGQSTRKEEYSFWEKIRNFAKGLEEALRKIWAKTKEILATGWYYASNFVKDFIYAKYPLTLKSERNWAISVTKGSTFDAMYDWTYEVKTHKTVEEVTEDATSGFSNDVAMTTANSHSVTNKASTSNKNVISRTVISKTNDLKVVQIVKYVNVIKEVTTWDEMLEMTSSEEKEYKVKKEKQKPDGTVIEEEITYDNRLAYVIEKISEDSSNSFKANSDDFFAAYDAIRLHKGRPYTTTGIYIDYSTLSDGAFGWPLERINGPVLTSCTGLRATVLGAGTETHGGDDIAAPEGTKILAAKDGKVITNQYMPGGYGYYVIIEHSNGWYTLYGHMVRQSTLGVGTEVQGGQVIGYVGTTGRSTGNHLHFEIRYGATGGFWSATKNEPLMLIDKTTIPTQLYATSDAGCPDSAYWGI